jgi:hypothetical protein
MSTLLRETQCLGQLTVWFFLTSLLKTATRLSGVIHAYNPSYLGSRDRKTQV